MPLAVGRRGFASQGVIMKFAFEAKDLVIVLALEGAAFAATFFSFGAAG